MIHACFESENQAGLAITAMVVAIVATLSTLYISEVVHQRIQEVYSIADLIKLHVFAVSKPAIRSGPEQFQD